MNSTRPYLIRAFYEWIVDNDCTPYIVVNAGFPGVNVPSQYVDNGQIVLNVSMSAVTELEIKNESVSFSARFAGVAHNLYIPITAVMAIYARENGRGMVFAEEDPEPPKPPKKDDENSSSDDNDKFGKGKGKPNLTIIK